MEASALLIFAGALLISVGTPGPSIAALVSRVLARGWRDVLPFLAAMWVGEIVWISIAVVGLAAVAQTYAFAFEILKWCGVAYLLVLAYQMWTSPVEVEATEIEGRGGVRMFVAGLLITAGNPKIMVFYVALLPTLLDITEITLSGWGSLILVAICIMATIDSSYVLLAHRVRTVLKEPKRMKWVNRFSAGVMASAAAFIAARS